VEDGYTGSGGPAEVGFDFGEGGRDAAGAAGRVFEVLDAAFADAGKGGEGELREAARFTRRSDGGGKLWPKQFGPVLCHGFHHAARFGNTHPPNPPIDQD